ncbi:MAG: dihydrolipoyl dehydrogenase [Clostridiales bacterium]|nr:dihydrolipoyl dehydrogenase [Clostridiales bacterium]
MKYDLMIIGGGPAGYLAAERAGHAGLSTILFEKNSVGGVCLNEGCVPSKALLYSAKIYDYAKTGSKYGVTFEGASIDQAAVIKRKKKVIKTLVSGVKGALKANKVVVIDGDAHIEKRSADGFNVSCNDTVYIGSRLMICTGSVPIMPPIKGLKEAYEKGIAMTNKEVLELTEIPEKLVVVGGGVIGLEMASYYNSAGSEVTVIEMLDRIAGMTDLDISKILMKNYEKKGIKFNLQSKVVEFTDNSVIYEKDGTAVEVAADKMLVSIGRRPFTQGIGIENIGVLLTERGAIITDDKGRTNIAEVYSAGDVNGKSMLAHTAYREAEVCINNILGKKDRMRYTAIPAVIYTNPEVASVGETEETAKQKGIDYECANITMRYSGRYVAENEGGNGICKVLVDKKYRKVIGVAAIGNYSSEFIYGASFMIETEMTVDDIKEIVFPHPTVSEVIREALFAF